MSSTTSKEYLVRGSRPDELEDVVAATAAAFKVPLPATSYREFVAAKCPDPENIRILLHNQGKMTHLIGSNTIFRFQTHFGPKILNAAGLAWVGVHPDYQRKGLGLLLLEDCISYLEQVHCDVCFLYTSTMSFYHARGWEVGFGTYKWVLPTVKILEQNALIMNKLPMLRLFTPEDLPKIQEIYAMSNNGHPGTCVRDLSYWRRMLKVYPSIFNRLYCFWDGPTIVGYILLEEPSKNPPDQVTVEEYGLTRPELEIGLLNAMKVLATDFSCLSLALTQPLTYSLVQQMKRLGAKDQNSLFGGLMARIMDLASFLAKWEAFYNEIVVPRVINTGLNQQQDLRIILTVENYGILLTKQGNSLHLEITKDTPRETPQIPVDRSVLAIMALGNISPSNLVDSDMWACPQQYLPFLDWALPDINLLLYPFDKF